MPARRGVNGIERQRAKNSGMLHDVARLIR
jgi:hypothetical protein